MAEEQTVSNFTKLNSPDWGRQKASTLVYMTQIKQHEQHLKNDSTARRPVPTVRFRDLSNIATPIQKTAVIGKEKVAEGGSVGGEEQPIAHNKSLPDLWESDAGFDKEIEVLPCGPRDGFPMAKGDGIDLQEPCLCDLLSDDPIPGVIEQGQERIELGAMKPASGSSQLAGPLRAGPFKF
ncbi:hypothetical protein FRC10_010148 [Ceratobasidium sp. 414]|nr:hypothetical protein FRC10_010148 [Ceratobasidium sp. 414]